MVSGVTARPPSSRSTFGVARPSTWPTRCLRATGSWSPAGCASAAGRPPRGRSGRCQPEVRYRQGRTRPRAWPKRPQPGAGAAGRTRRRLQRPAAVLAWLAVPPWAPGELPGARPFGAAVRPLPGSVLLHGGQVVVLIADSSEEADGPPADIQALRL